MNNNILNIETIKKLLSKKNIIWTKHCLNRLNQREISIADVKYAINTGYIIETYNNDYPFPSCLILGKTKIHENLHIVCGVSKTTLYIITVYYPDNVNWYVDLRRRKK